MALGRSLNDGHDLVRRWWWRWCGWWAHGFRDGSHLGVFVLRFVRARGFTVGLNGTAGIRGPVSADHPVRVVASSWSSILVAWSLMLIFSTVSLLAVCPLFRAPVSYTHLTLPTTPYV